MFAKWHPKNGKHRQHGENRYSCVLPVPRKLHQSIYIEAQCASKWHEMIICDESERQRVVSFDTPGNTPNIIGLKVESTLLL
jgi:hypothetical protein